MGHTDISENTPLLGGKSSQCNIPERSAHTQKVLRLVCGLLAVLDLAVFLAVAPQTKIFEQIVCTAFYEQARGLSTDLDDERCKTEAVQSEVAFIIGWKDTLDQIPSTLFAIMWGTAADRFGRKPVLLLSLLGCLLADLWVKAICLSGRAPLRLVWASGLWQLIGGGAQVSSSMFFVVIADVFTEESRVSAFSYLAGTALLSETLATPLSAALMQRSPWIPFWLSTVVLAFGFVLAWFLPETGCKGSAVELPKQNIAAQDERTFCSRVERIIHTATRDTRIVLLLYVFLVAALSRQVLPQLIFYGSNRFKWSISESSLLISLRAAVNLLLLLVLLPAASKLLTRYGVRGNLKDLRVSQTSGALLALGSALIFLAPVPAVAVGGVVILALGSAFHLAARSLITSLSLPQHVATIYSIISFVIALGTLLAGPLLANILQLGMKAGKEWTGLPFGAVCVLYLTALCAISFVKLGTNSPTAPIFYDEL